jgi:hypothetical protein
MIQVSSVRTRSRTVLPQSKSIVLGLSMYMCLNKVQDSGTMIQVSSGIFVRTNQVMQSTPVMQNVFSLMLPCWKYVLLLAIVIMILLKIIAFLTER